MGMQIDRQIDRQADGKKDIYMRQLIDRQADRQTDNLNNQKKIDRQTNIYRYIDKLLLG